MFRFVSALCRINSSAVLKQSQVQGRALNVCRTLYARHFHVSSATYGSVGEGFHRTSDFDKKILVWTKMFPSVTDVPEEVTQTKMKKAKDIFRIRVNIMMALMTVGLCVVYIWSGKSAVRRGETIHQQNKERHLEFMAQAKK